MRFPLPRVLESRQSQGLERGAAVRVGLEVEPVIDDQPEHQPVAKDAVASEHPPDRDRTECRELLGEVVDELAHPSSAPVAMQLPGHVAKTPGEVAPSRPSGSDGDHLCYLPVNRAARFSMNAARPSL